MHRLELEREAAWRPTIDDVERLATHVRRQACFIRNEARRASDLAYEIRIDTLLRRMAARERTARVRRARDY